MTKFYTSVDIQDVITCATFCDDRLRGLGVARGRISRFPIDLRRRPYNTCTTVPVCERRDWPSRKTLLRHVYYPIKFGRRSDVGRGSKNLDMNCLKGLHSLEINRKEKSKVQPTG